MKLSEQRQIKIQNYIEKLTKTLRRNLKIADLKLTPFGSVINGFGSRNCDLDLCLQTCELIQVRNREK